MFRGELTFSILYHTLSLCCITQWNALCLGSKLPDTPTIVCLCVLMFVCVCEGIGDVYCKQTDRATVSDEPPKKTEIRISASTLLPKDLRALHPLGRLALNSQPWGDVRVWGPDDILLGCAVPDLWNPIVHYRPCGKRLLGILETQP